MDFVGMVGLMGKWAVGHWIVGVTSFQKIYGLFGLKHHIVEISGGVTSFQKIYGLYSVKHHKVEKWSNKVGRWWVLWVWWVCVGDG